MRILDFFSRNNVLNYNNRHEWYILTEAIANNSLNVFAKFIFLSFLVSQSIYLNRIFSLF